MRISLAYLSVVLGIVVLAGCQGLPKDYHAAASAAIEDYAQTTLGKALEEAAGQHPGKSGFSIIRQGREAFLDRLVMTDLAEKSLDLQYYIWEDDATGRILSERLLRAADRGVRVRVLLDDINVKGRDAVLAALNAHPGIAIRLFNPFASRGFPGLDFITNFNRVNHRMHNKAMIADNALAIIGGRNIGNHYFGVATDANFRDLDTAAAGPVVRDISSVFDHFWNGPWSIPISALVDEAAGEAELQEAVERLRERIAAIDYPFPLDQGIAELKGRLQTILAGFIWAPGTVIWDDPAAIVKEGRTSRIRNAMFERTENLTDELLIESAYFVLRDHGVRILTGLTDKGIRVRILTNSLASNDVLAAHAGYSKHRRDLVAGGVELYELRPFPGPVEKNVVAAASKAALHTKTVVFDRQDVFIGSFNLDPRSGEINTEIGVYISSPELAAQVAAYMDEGTSPKNSYRVLLDEDGDLTWVIESGDERIRYEKDPDSTFWQRFLVGFLRLLPIQGQL